MAKLFSYLWKYFTLCLVKVLLAVNSWILQWLISHTEELNEPLQSKSVLIES